jgi:hypothetical protein
MLKAALLLLPLAALSVTGCKKDLQPSCRIAQSLTLPASRLTQARDVALQRVGDNFVLIGVEGDEVRWAPISANGALGTESTLTVPARTLRREPWFGVTSKSAPGDQLVVAYVAPKAGTANQLQILGITQTPGAAASAPSVLAELPAGVDPAIVRLAMGSSLSGKRAVLTWGFEGQDASPQVLLLGPDAMSMAPPANLFRAPGARWRCLAMMPSRTEFGISLLEQASATPTWRGFELKDDGSRGFDVNVVLDLVPTSCVTSAPTGRGYMLAYQNGDGTFFSDYNLDKSVVNSDIVAGVLQFGGAHKQPPVACVSPMGSDFSFLFDRPGGGEVWRVDAFGVPQGEPLVLPSMAGQVGPLAAVPGRDVFHATYLDERPAPSSATTDGSSMGNSRQFVRVDCPMAAPALLTDAGIGTPMVDAGK